MALVQIDLHTLSIRLANFSEWILDFIKITAMVKCGKVS